MFSVDDINEMQKTIERKDRIIKVLKERVRQWVKEYNILDFIIEAFKISENEANEIITELKAKNEKLEKELKNNKTAYEVELGTYNMECGNLLEENKQYHQTLQEIKTIAEKTIDIYYPDYYDEGFEEDIVTEFAKQVLDLITKAEEE